MSIAREGWLGARPAAEPRRLGALCLSYDAMGKLLHLRDGLSIVGVKADPATETVEFLIAGAFMPAKLKGAPTVRLPFNEFIDSELEQVGEKTKL